MMLGDDDEPLQAAGLADVRDLVGVEGVRGEQGGVFVAMAPFAVGVEILGLTYRVRRCIILIIIFIDNTKWNYFPLWRHHDGH